MTKKVKPEWKKWMVVKIVEGNDIYHALDREPEYKPIHIQPLVKETEQLTAAIGIDAEAIPDEPEDYELGFR